MKAIVILSGKGGVGKSTVSINASSKVVNSLPIGYDSTQNFNFINEKRKLLEEKIPNIKKSSFIQSSYKQVNDKTEKIEHIDILNDVLSAVEKKEQKLGEEIIAFFDMGGYETTMHNKMLSLAETIIIPSGFDELDLQYLETVSNTLKSLSKDLGREVQANVLASRIHYKSTKTGKGFKRLEEEVAKFDNLFLLDTIIFERKDYRTAMNNGCSVFEYPQTKGSKATREMTALLNELELPLKHNGDI